ncbi:MAG: rRNA maturation RNase YbeY [Planctomycetaceae bacterium]|nr:rRNA maturation RNase YbeY [Planctomycetaceae bacterium]
MPANSQPNSRRVQKSAPRGPEILSDWLDRYEVEIDDSQKTIPVDQRRLCDVVRTVLAAERCASAAIGLAIVDNETIHDLNIRYLQHDFPTDVLSFLLESELDEASLPIPKGAPRGCGKRLEGEIIVSAEMAKQFAAKYRWKPLDELTLYVVHGLLHLCGYDDRSSKELAVMRQRETEVLAEWSLTPHYASRDDE